MSNKTERHLFPAGNTSEGFYSFFDYIIDKKEANRVFCMKGGPGTGKSFLMKKVGNHYADQGYSIEYFHCSSDNNSLDGVVVKELKVCILDGTSPHIVDPKYPLAVDEILNMAECLDSNKIIKNKDKILDIMPTISNYFNRAYRFFAAAAPIYKDIEFYNECYLNKDKLVLLKNELASKIIGDNIKTGYGKERHLFGTAFTPNGIITYIPNIIENIKNQYILDGNIGSGKTFVLNEIAKTAREKGYFVEYFHTPLIKDKLEAIIIPELDSCIISKSVISKLSLSGTVYDMNSIKSKIPNNINNEIQYDYNIMMGLINKGLSLITNAHADHDILESYFIDSFDFAKADAIYDEVIRKIDTFK